MLTRATKSCAITLWHLLHHIFGSISSPHDVGIPAFILQMRVRVVQM